MNKKTPATTKNQQNTDQNKTQKKTQIRKKTVDNIGRPGFNSA